MPHSIQPWSSTVIDVDFSIPFVGWVVFFVYVCVCSTAVVHLLHIVIMMFGHEYKRDMYDVPTCLRAREINIIFVSLIYN